MVALATQDQVDTRRHAGYGFLGAGERSLMYWKYFQWYSVIEYRMANLLQEEVDLLVDTYLPNLNALEMSTATAQDNLDTSRAAVWVHNDNEVADRAALYTYYRGLLCAVLQVPPGPWFAGTSNSVRMLV